MPSRPASHCGGEAVAAGAPTGAGGGTRASATRRRSTLTSATGSRLRAERAQEAVAEGAHPPDRRRRAGAHPVRPAPPGDPAHHRRVVGDDRDRHVVAGAVSGDDRGGLVVAQHDHHQVLAAVVLDEREQRAQRVLDRPAVALLDVAQAGFGRPGSLLKIEPSPTSPQLMSGGMRVHGAWLDTRSTSAKSGGRWVLRKLEALQGQEDVLVGHRGVRVGRAAVADVAAVVDLVVVVERRPLRPVPVVRRHVVDRPPSGALERLAEREAVALRRAGRSDRWLLTHVPDWSVECASQLMPPKVGEVSQPLRDEKPAARSCSVPASRTVSTCGENDDPWTATFP